MKVKKANCGASVPASKKVKMAMGGMVRKASKSDKDKRGDMKGPSKGSKKSYKDE